jgi:hypothetical protein
LFFRSQKGTVSIYFMIIFVAIFLFNAVLIDYARIYAAKREGDMATRAVVRSVLSSFDKDLHEQYGLFGYDAKETEDQMVDIIKGNLSTDTASKSFQYIDPKLESQAIQPEASYNLGNQTIFKQQVLEDMKYKAPIELTVEVVDKFAKIAKVMGKASTATKAAKNMKKPFEIREKELDDLWALRKEIAQSSMTISSSMLIGVDEIDIKDKTYDQFKPLYNSKFTRWNADSNAKMNDAEVISIVDILLQYPDLRVSINKINTDTSYLGELNAKKDQLVTEESALEAQRNTELDAKKKKQKAEKNEKETEGSEGNSQPTTDSNTSSFDNAISEKQDQIQLLDKEIGEMMSLIANEKGNVNRFLNKSHALLNNLSKQLKDLKDKYDAASKLLNDAKDQNTLMIEALEKAKAQTNDAKYDAIAESSPDESETKGATSTIDEIQVKLDKMILADIYFTQIEGELYKEKELLIEFQSHLMSFQQSLPKQYSEPFLLINNDEEIKKNLKEIYLQYLIGAFNHQYLTNYPLEAEREKARAEYLKKKANPDPVIKKREEDSKGSLSQVIAIIKKFKEAKDDITQYRDEYKELKRYYNCYTLNSADCTSPVPEPSAEAISEINNDSDDTGDQSMMQMDDLFKNMADYFYNLRNELYVNEYAFSHFKSFTPKLELDETKPVDPTALLNGITSLLDVRNSEMEYIIYGNHEVGTNIASAYGEVFLVRLAIRTLEGFADKRIKLLVFPLLVVAAAIAYGLVKAIIDMIQLMNGEDVVLTSFFPKLRLSYKDYLKLFLLIHPDESKKLARMQALVQFHTEKDLRQYSIYSRGSAALSVRLWFIPGIIKSLNLIGVLDGKVQGNRYYYQSKMFGNSY